MLEICVVSGCEPEGRVVGILANSDLKGFGDGSVEVINVHYKEEGGYDRALGDPGGWAVEGG